MSQSSIALDVLVDQVENHTSTDRGKVNMSGTVISKDEMLANAERWKDRERAERRARENFVKDLINEYASYESFGGHSYGLSLCVSKLAKHDKKIFLTYIVDIEDYEWFCESETRLEAAFKEYESEMQFWIDEYIDEVWHDIMQEAGKCLKQHSDNGEYYY